MRSLVEIAADMTQTRERLRYLEAEAEATAHLELVRRRCGRLSETETFSTPVHIRMMGDCEDD